MANKSKIRRRRSHKVKSSAIDKLRYNPKNSELDVFFKNRKQPHTYTGVEKDVYTRLKNADSIGKFYNKEIKGTYEAKKLAHISPLILKHMYSELEKEAVLTPGSTLTYLNSPNKLKQNIGLAASKVHEFAANPVFNKAVNKGVGGSFAGPEFAAASTAGSLIRSAAQSKGLEGMADMLGLRDIESNHATAFTPAGILYGKLKGLALGLGQAYLESGG